MNIYYPLGGIVAKGQSSFISFLRKLFYHFFNLSNQSFFIGYIISIFRLFTDGSIIAKSAIIEDIKAKREHLFEEFDFIADANKSLHGMTVMQRLYLLDFKRKQDEKESYYTAVTFSSQFAPISRMVNKAESVEQLKVILQDNAIDVVQMYVINNLDDLIRFELLNIITHELVFKKCKYCGHYFVPYGRSDMEYCPRVYIGENKPCDQIGAMNCIRQKRGKMKSMWLFRRHTAG